MTILLAVIIALGGVAPIAPTTSTAPVDEVSPLFPYSVLYGTVRFDDTNGYVVITYTEQNSSVTGTTTVDESGSWSMDVVGLLDEGQLEAHYYREVGDDWYRYEYNIVFPDDYIWMSLWGHGYHWCHQWNPNFYVLAV